MASSNEYPLEMTDRGFLTETDREILAGEYDGTDEGRGAATYRLRRRTENSLRELSYVAASPEISVDVDVWYRHLHQLLRQLMEPPQGVTPPKDYEGTIGDHFDEYLLQHALFEICRRLVEDYDDQLHAEPESDRAAAFQDLEAEIGPPS